MDSKIIFRLFFFIIFLIPAHSHAIEFKGKFLQGHFIVGITNPSAKIIIDKKDPTENPLASKIANHVYDMAKLSVGGLDQEQIINLQNNNADLISELLNSTN